MVLTTKQEEALKVAVDRYRHGEKYTIISGYAGSGKSTVIRFIVQALGVPEEQIAYAAFTGKAAKVLQQKGCFNATTAHKLLYNASPTKDGKYIFVPKKRLNEKLVIIDEVSMLPKPMWDLLCSHNVYILATGDPGQLPPINPEDDNHVLDHPHVFLDEIMRQAQESEIIRLSMHVRQGNPLSTFEAGGAQVQIYSPEEVVEGMYPWADQILCATNARRNEINQTMRNLKGFGPEPCIGDKIISLRNHWDDFSSCGNALTNGTIGYLTEFKKDIIKVPPFIYDKAIPILDAKFTTDEGDSFDNIIMDYNSLAFGEKTLNPRQEYAINKNKACPNAPYDFVYGYGVTCHKAQGSEWNKVLVFEERFPFSFEDHRRWLYTAVTRASEKLVIVRK